MITFRYAFPPMEEFTLDNGLHVILVPDKEQDATVFALQMPVGRFSDPIGCEGTAEMTMSLIQKGTKNIKPEQFSERLENTGAMMFSDMGEEHCAIGIRSLSRHTDELLEMFWDMICNPLLDKKEFQRLQQEMTTAVQAEQVDPVLLANRHFYTEFAGKEHPAGRFHTLQTIKRVRAENVDQYYADYFTPKNALFVIVGNIDPEKIKNRWKPQLALWENKSVKEPVIATQLPNPNKSIIRVVNKPDLTQTTLIVGHAAPGELSPDKNAVALANYVFGAGNFSSRLMSSVRSKGGKTYGISSQIAQEKTLGVFTVSTSTANGQVGEVLKTIMEEYKRFGQDGLSEEELDKAKKFAIGSLSFQLEGIGNIADKLLWLRFYNRENSYIENFDAMINAIDLQKINDTIKRTFSVDQFVISAVGRSEEMINHLSSHGEIKQFNYRDQF